ncbi:hypothetical protein TELCIR_02303 [Teladorsagia circumcincta]|uniref:Uncharacterized protein n=1 Tax=Teladorsagia circumcincta TaxID=45464 RepID=A0A2G9UZL0_TELCI|nr:hypothetical protein TELCIR_02303 [Teladorsagia circumcincta]
MRVKDGADEDGIKLYIPAFDESGEGFLLYYGSNMVVNEGYRDFRREFRGSSEEVPNENFSISERRWELAS